MNGNQAYINTYENKIKTVIKKHPNLIGFRNFLTDNSIATVYQYVYYVSCFLDYINKTPEQLVFDDFTSYLNHIRTNQHGEQATSSFKIAMYSALKKYNIYLVAANILPVNYMNNIKRPKPMETQKTIEKREKGFLTEDEISTYLYNVRSGIKTYGSNDIEYYRERDMAIVMILLNTGIRCSALIRLDVDDIDFEASEIIVIDKGSKINRHFISEDTKSCIKKWLIKREHILNGIPEKALFISDRRCRISNSSLYRLINKYTQNIDGKNITPHKLRATYGTQLYNATKDLFFVQEMMGHSNPQTTTLYIRDKSDMKEKASNIMSNLTKLN